jgi:hypothetical protein
VARLAAQLTAGDFRNLGYDEAVFSYTLTSGNSGCQVFWYAYLLSKGGFMGLGPPYPGASPAGWTWGNGWESDAVAADLNPDAQDGDELVVAGPGEVAVLKFNVTTDAYGMLLYTLLLRAGMPDFPSCIPAPRRLTREGIFLPPRIWMPTQATLPGSRKSLSPNINRIPAP